MEKQALTERSALLINIMFSDPSVMETLIDKSESNLWSKVSIDAESCEIVLGKTRYGWWNRLIGAEKRISIETFALRMISILKSRANKHQNGDVIAKGLADDIIEALDREGRSNDIIDRLFLVGYLGVKTAWSCTSLSAEGSVGGTRGPVDVNLHVNKKTYTFALPGSGDEILEVEIGPTGARWLGR